VKELLKTLCAIDGVPGYEDAVRRVIADIARPFADELSVDPLGTLLVLKKGKKRRVRPFVVAAHMDEVGFLASGHTEDGCITLTPAGGVDPRVLIGRRMKVGPKGLPGVISLKAIHLTTPEERKIAPPLSSLYVDIGCTSKAEAQKLVAVGDPIAFDSPFVAFGDNCVKSKALDDRVGCAVALKLLQEDPAYDTWFAFTTGEEIGCRGASVIGNRLEPGAALVLEGTTAADMPKVEEHKQSTRLRHGAVVSVLDGGTVYNRELRRKMCDKATELGIPWQLRRSANGGTDASALHTSGPGALAFGLAAPTRYIHCAMNVCYLPDVDAVLNMARLFCEEVGELNV
jgi:endoglucanase